jgi:PhnB protein
MAARRAKATKSTSARKSAPSRKATKAKKKKVEAVPAKYGTATPSLIVSPCTEALDFYQRAFGARLLSSMDGPGGVVMHAEIRIGDSIIMVSDEMPPMPGQPATRKTPKNAGAITGGVMLYVKDTDAAFERAVKAGGKGVMPPADQFWGDRYAQVEDPFGHVWAIGTHVRDVTPKQMRAAMAQMGPPPA